MTRRQLIALAASSLPMACGSPRSSSRAGQRQAVVGKKGLCLSEKMRPARENSRFLQAVCAHWLYNWKVEIPQELPEGIAYTPMIYRPVEDLHGQLAWAKKASELGFTELLGFNEPDAESQGNTTVEEALSSWPKLVELGLRLGSPATVHPDNEWMLGFMRGVEQRGLRVDFTCIHSYGSPNAEALISKIEKIHALYKRPVWITEFAVADWKAETAAQNRFAAEKVAEFVVQVLPRLEAMDIVERYSWFHGGVSGGPLASSQLFHADGSLTVVGEAYRSVG